MGGAIEARGSSQGLPLSVAIEQAQVAFTLGEGASTQRETRELDALTCRIGPANVSGWLWLAGALGLFPVTWFAVADEFGLPSVLAALVLAGAVALALVGVSRTRWPVMFATRSEFVAADFGWRQLARFRSLERALQASKLSRAWAGRSVLSPAGLWTELRLAVAPTDALLEAQRELEQSPMHRRDYRLWRQRHALAVVFIGLGLPAAVTLGLLVTRDARTSSDVVGVLFLGFFVLLPAGMWGAHLMRRAMVRAAGVSDETTLRPMFRRP